MRHVLLNQGINIVLNQMMLKQFKSIYHHHRIIGKMSPSIRRTSADVVIMINNQLVYGQTSNEEKDLDKLS